VDAREACNWKIAATPETFEKDHPITLVSSKRTRTPSCGGTARPGARIPWKEFFRTGKFVARTRADGAIRKLADVVIETTQFNVHELRHFVTERFKNPDKRPMLVSVVSFGYRYGVPSDADLVLDVRFLPNPHFVLRLRPFTANTRKCGGISDRSRRPENSCGASKACSPI